MVGSAWDYHSNVRTWHVERRPRGHWLKVSSPLFLLQGLVEPAKMLFGDVGVVTCLPRFTLSVGVKCGANAVFVPVGSLPVCSPRSCGVPPEVSRALRSAEEGQCNIPLRIHRW